MTAREKMRGASPLCPVELISAVDKQNIPLLEEILDANPGSVNCFSMDWNTGPLQYAVLRRRWEALLVLLARGASPLAGIPCALEVAALKGFHEATKLLLQHCNVPVLHAAVWMQDVATVTNTLITDSSAVCARVIANERRYT
jgi:hypothetical protein